MTSVAAESFFYDPFSPVVQQDPYPFYRVLLDRHPVWRTPERECWTLSRYEDIQSAARDWKTFSNSRGVELDDVVDVYPDTFGPGIVINTDPPDHGRIRKVVHKSFTPRSVQAFEPVVRANVAELLDELTASESPDLASGFAWRLPVLTTSDLLGFPRSDHPLILGWMLELEARDPDVDLAEMPASARSAASDLADYIAASLEERRGRPRDDLLSLFVAAEESGQLAHGESRGLTFIFVLAGIDTTACLVSNTLHRLAPRPDDRARFVADHDRIPAAVEEMIRYEAPVQGLARVTTRDVEMHGAPIPGGRGCGLPTPPPIATRGCSRTPTSSTSTARRRATSASGRGSTTASGPPWPGSRAASPWRCSSPAFPTTRSPERGGASANTPPVDGCICRPPWRDRPALSPTSPEKGRHRA